MLEIIIFLLAFGADFAVKFWSMEVLSNIPGKTINILPNVFWLLYAENDGENVSYIRSNEPPMIIFRILQALLFIFIMIKYRKKLAGITRIALSMFLAGMAGNQFNYLTMGFVPDMFVIARIPSVFNVADVLIIVSSTILFIRFAFFEGQEFVDWLVRKPDVPKKIRRKRRRDKIVDPQADVGWERESAAAGYNYGYLDEADDQGYLLPDRNVSLRESNGIASEGNRAQSSGSAYDFRPGTPASGERNTVQGSRSAYNLHPGTSLASRERKTPQISRSTYDTHSNTSEASDIDVEKQTQTQKVKSKPYNADVRIDIPHSESFDTTKPASLQKANTSSEPSKAARSTAKDTDQIKPFERQKPAEKKKSFVPPDNWPSHFPPPRGDY